MMIEDFSFGHRFLYLRGLSAVSLARDRRYYRIFLNFVACAIEISLRTQAFQEQDLFRNQMSLRGAVSRRRSPGLSQDRQSPRRLGDCHTPLRFVRNDTSMLGVA